MTVRSIRLGGIFCMGLEMAFLNAASIGAELFTRTGTGLNEAWEANSSSQGSYEYLLSP
ncbi:hypothetical protein [Rhizobium leguminosarum]|uniref:hypothetical protein n=1 Tax=Rhizobium leguminosarum TaxID=384 RepID=UPI003D6F9616